MSGRSVFGGRWDHLSVHLVGKLSQHTIILMYTGSCWSPGVSAAKSCSFWLAKKETGCEKQVCYSSLCKRCGIVASGLI